MAPMPRRLKARARKSLPHRARDLHTNMAYVSHATVVPVAAHPRAASRGSGRNNAQSHPIRRGSSGGGAHNVRLIAPAAPARARVVARAELEEYDFVTRMVGRCKFRQVSQAPV